MVHFRDVCVRVVLYERDGTLCARAAPVTVPSEANVYDVCKQIQADSFPGRPAIQYSVFAGAAISGEIIEHEDKAKDLLDQGIGTRANPLHIVLSAAQPVAVNQSENDLVNKLKELLGQNLDQLATIKELLHQKLDRLVKETKSELQTLTERVDRLPSILNESLSTEADFSSISQAQLKEKVLKAYGLRLFATDEVATPPRSVLQPVQVDVFEWGESAENSATHKEAYLEYIKDTLLAGLQVDVFSDVSFDQPVGEFAHLRGKVDVLVGPKGSNKYMCQDTAYVLFELKQTPEWKWKKSDQTTKVNPQSKPKPDAKEQAASENFPSKNYAQAIAQLISADILSAPYNLAVLTDLDDRWFLFWLAHDGKHGRSIISYRCSRPTAVALIREFAGYRIAFDKHCADESNPMPHPPVVPRGTLIKLLESPDNEDVSSEGTHPSSGGAGGNGDAASGGSGSSGSNSGPHSFAAPPPSSESSRTEGKPSTGGKGV